MAVTLVDIPASPGRSGRTRVRLAFRSPLRWVVARRLDEVAAVLDEAHSLSRQGRWCVGWVTYEAAAGLDPAFVPGNHVHPHAEGALAAFAVFDQAVEWSDDDESPAGWRTEPWRSDLLEASGTRPTPHFTQLVDTIRQRIADGDFYQVNLTTRLESTLTGDALAYFHALRRSQPDGYLFRLRHDLDGVEEQILSVSPELFFHWTDDALRTQPMKGTAPRGATPDADAAAADALRASPKERAENLMIVDLLRNDLSRIATLGSVRVPSLFELHALSTVWQMTSTIEARTRPGVRLSGIFAALFPCGSVTGAPKRAAMAGLRALEADPRGVYCGAVGVMRPGGEVLFNVPIRTVTLRAAGEVAGATRWRAQCGVGSGITFDSRAGDEAREWHHKQGFLRRAASPFELLETLRLEDGRYWLQHRHLARLERSAAHFGIPMDRAGTIAALEEHAAGRAAGVHRVRLRMNVRGGVVVESSPLAPTPATVRLAWAGQPMPPADEFIVHKTTRRDAYAPFRPRPEAAVFDTLLWNARGRITETTFGNIALRIGGTWITPDVSAGLLPGVYREALLADGRIVAGDVLVEDMERATGAAFLNSVRGWVDVDWPSLQTLWRQRAQA
ncbi:MAG: chorismate-binding protein [Burkholderiales bacterium]